MSGQGRRRDPVWIHFTEINLDSTSKLYKRAKCTKCSAEMAALVSRMRAHVKKCQRPASNIDIKLDQNQNVDSDSESESENSNSFTSATTSASSISNISANTITNTKTGNFLCFFF